MLCYITVLSYLISEWCKKNFDLKLEEKKIFLSGILSENYKFLSILHPKLPKINTTMVFVEIKVFVFIFVAFMFLVDFGFTQAIISQSIDITIKGANVTKVIIWVIKE